MGSLAFSQTLYLTHDVKFIIFYAWALQYLLVYHKWTCTFTDGFSWPFTVQNLRWFLKWVPNSLSHQQRLIIHSNGYSDPWLVLPWKFLCRHRWKVWKPQSPLQLVYHPQRLFFLILGLYPKLFMYASYLLKQVYLELQNFSLGLLLMCLKGFVVSVLIFTYF